MGRRECILECGFATIVLSNSIANSVSPSLRESEKEIELLYTSDSDSLLARMSHTPRWYDDVDSHSTQC